MNILRIEVNSLEKTHKGNISSKLFFELCEQILEHPDQQKLHLPNPRAWIRFYLSSILGSIGLCLGYMLRVLRPGKITLITINGVAIIDIKAGLILNKSGAKRQSSHLHLSRLHWPSFKIMAELINGFQRYSRLKSNNPTFSLGKVNKVSEIAANNPNYLNWFADYCFYRSVLIANKRLISTKINAVFSISEFTPRNSGILSFFYEAHKPLILYLPFSSMPRVNFALPLFNVVLASNGCDADAVKNAKCTKIFLEDNKYISINISCKENPNVAIFLASHYNLEYNELEYLVETEIIPFMKNIRVKWSPLNLALFCHPNDHRVSALLAQYGMQTGNPNDSIGDKLMNIDLVVIGNSSVAEAALIRGIPVAYSSNLDSYSYDLYGYIKKGLVLDISDTVPMVPEILSFYAQKRISQNIKSHFCGHLPHPSITIEKLLLAAAQKEEWIYS